MIVGVSKINQVMVGANPCGRPRQGRYKTCPYPKSLPILILKMQNHPAIPGGVVT
jgi:hypothetical protein